MSCMARFDAVDDGVRRGRAGGEARHPRAGEPLGPQVAGALHQEHACAVPAAVSRRARGCCCSGRRRPPRPRRTSRRARRPPPGGVSSARRRCLDHAHLRQREPAPDQRTPGAAPARSAASSVRRRRTGGAAAARATSSSVETTSNASRSSVSPRTSTWFGVPTMTGWKPSRCQRRHGPVSRPDDRAGGVEDAEAARAHRRPAPLGRAVRRDRHARRVHLRRPRAEAGCRGLPGRSSTVSL